MKTLEQLRLDGHSDGRDGVAPRSTDPRYLFGYRAGEREREQLRRYEPCESNGYSHACGYHD